MDTPMTKSWSHDVQLQLSESPINYEVNTDIKLTQKEKDIFNFIIGVMQHYKKNTICRVAGGWVRDKLMGKSSDDIDIALDDMYGEELAEMLRQKIFEEDSANGKVDPKKANAKGYGVIKSNSDKSKHLETAVIKVMGEFIDLVNLRSEEYAQDSRVPVIKIGTPLEDALRRDLTINSMFYNINTNQVEDLTG